MPSLSSAADLPRPFLRVVIVEDEPLARETLREYVAGTAGLVLVGEAGDGEGAVRLLDAVAPDLTLLDVSLPGGSGFDVLERAAAPGAVVFTTAYDQYAVAAFEAEAVDYLLKPITRARFDVAVERVRRRLEPASSRTSADRPAADGPEAAPVRARRALAAPYLERVLVRVGETLTPVVLADVTRLEADDDYTVVHAGGRRHVLGITLGLLAERLDPARFRRVHRSHVINLDHVRAASVEDRRLRLHLRDGSQVLTSRAGALALRDLIL